MDKSLRTVRLGLLLIICSMILMVCGCGGGRRPALNPNPKKKSKALSTKSLEKKSIGIFTLRTSNQFKESFQPKVRAIRIAPKGKKKSGGWAIGKPNTQRKKEFYEYLISVDLAPGEYTIDDVIGGSGNILVYGSFAFPISATFDLSPGSIVYLGHVDMVNRKRKDGERRSGSIFPLIDQAATGFANSTFDVSISDRGVSDIPLFKKVYPQLEDHMIQKSIMSD